MTPAALTTILTTAPAIVQTVTRLIRTLREQEQPVRPDAEMPATVAGLKVEVERLSARLESNSDNDVQQLQLIQELARQNEAMAGSVARLSRRVAVLTWVAAAALLLALALALLAAAGA